MIKVLDSNFNRLGIIKNVIDCERLEEINGENVLDFNAILDDKLSMFIDEDAIFEIENQYFDVALIKKSRDEDHLYSIEIESEHISYRLNDPLYNIEFFTEVGTPSYILNKILENTGFSIGKVEFEEPIVYSTQEAKSRRQLIMEFVALLGGEIYFNNFIIDILKRRGSSNAKQIIKDRNVKIISKTINKRSKDEEDIFVSYICTPIDLPRDYYELGDDIRLLQKDFGLDEALRVVRISYNPYTPTGAIFTFANYTNGLESQLYKIALSTVVKDKLYNGIRIGPEYGFEAVRGDKRARSYFRSDGMAFQTGDGTGENWVDRLYFQYNSETDQTELIFDGTFSVKNQTIIQETIESYVDDNLGHRVEIFSTNGTVFRNGQISTILIARVYKGPEDVTDLIDVNFFKWTRISDDPAGDEIWNAQYYGGAKQIEVTTDDIYRRATFVCKIMKYEGVN